MIEVTFEYRDSRCIGDSWRKGRMSFGCDSMSEEEAISRTIREMGLDQDGVQVRNISASSDEAGYAYEIDAESAWGTPADSWAELADAILDFRSLSLSLDEAERIGRSLAARAVLLAGGERTRR